MQKRHQLCVLLLTLLVCNTFVTLNTDIAIVSMVNSQNAEVTFNKTSTICPNSNFFLGNYLKDDNDANESLKNVNQNSGYNWSEAEQNLVLSGYYWLNYVAIMPGGILAHKYGAKIVVGYAQLISSTMSSLIPMAAQSGPLAVSWIRAVQGVLSFMSMPAGVYSIMGNWSPPHERAKFGANFMFGTYIGMTAGSFLFGLIGQYLHWSIIFHFTSLCGVIWSIFWYLLVHDTPAKHPTISVEEKEYIVNSLKKATCKTKNSIPWTGIVTSVPLVACILTESLLIWVWVMMTTYFPKYLKIFYSLNSNEIGIITGVPNIITGILIFVIAYYNDLIIKKNILTTTTTRKISTMIGGILSMIPLIIIAITECNLTLVISCSMIYNVMSTFQMFGTPLVLVDMSPKFCGILEGFSGTTSSLLTFVFSAVVNYFSTIYDVNLLWKMVFLSSSMGAIFISVIFLFFGTSEVQRWNFKDDAEKNQPLNASRGNQTEIL
ncbi:sialin-like [Planococcus citri]|uniref:sialin-like n=1 Tax=Planococcus citri TaxID=170843 RepID=UPI0031FA1984